jgi:hypothetical protein
MISNWSIGSSFLPQKMFTTEALYRRGKKFIPKEKIEKTESNLDIQIKQN